MSVYENIAVDSHDANTRGKLIWGKAFLFLNVGRGAAFGTLDY